jgi:putative ABC transport system permease protein
MRPEHWLYTIRLRLRSLVRWAQADQELDDELRDHLERTAKEYGAQGMAPEDAWRRALVDLGGIEQTKELCREARRVNWIHDFAQDLHFGLRILRKSPGFTAIAILTLALGIGASTSIFSVVDAVLLRPLPYPNPQQIVRIWERALDGHQMHLAGPNLRDFRSQNNTFAGLAGYSEATPSSISGGSEPTRVNVAAVSADFFKSLGVDAFLGRTFVPEEHREHGSPAIILGYGYWQRYLGAATDLSQFHLAMEGRAFSVVGVMPAGFDFPFDVAAWVPSEAFGEDSSRTAHNWNGLGRLRSGITVAQARADLSTIAHRIKDQYGKDVDLNDAAVVPLADAMVGDVRIALLNLLGAVGLLLLVACANVAGLLLARTSARQRELAVRAALGASRRRLMQQFLAESFVLSSAGGVLGALLALWAVKTLPAILPTNLPRQHGIAVNTPVLLFALAAVVAVAVFLGLFSAWRAGTGDLQEALSAGSRSHSGSASSHRLRSFLVVGEIATTLIILIGAGLLGRSFLRLISTSPGFRQENLITMEFSPSIPLDTPMDSSAIARQVRLTDDIVARLRAIPGAESVGLAGAIPVANGDNLADGTFLLLNGQNSPTTWEEWGRMAQNPSLAGHALYCVASEGYFRTVGIPLIRGRLFNDHDGSDSPQVALISQTLARLRWPNEDPVGQVINFGNMDGSLKSSTIVGVVGDVRAEGLDHPPSPIVYVDYRQRGMNGGNASPTILMRTAMPPGEIIPAARGVFRDLAPDAPVKFSTFAQELGGWLADRRFLLLLVGVFAIAALTLAAVGIYGVVAFSVTRRTQEIGIRMSLGAQRGNILGLVLGEGARMAALGVVIGIGVSLAITRVMSSLLFDVSATDPFTFVGVAVLLSGIALLASYIPARRAMRVDPMVALRYE